MSRPTAAGWYWWKATPKSAWLPIRLMRGGVWIPGNIRADLDPDRLIGEWGPRIEPPKDCDHAYVESDGKALACMHCGHVVHELPEDSS